MNEIVPPRPIDRNPTFDLEQCMCLKQTSQFENEMKNIYFQLKSNSAKNVD
jgi:hypothetical protein